MNTFKVELPKFQDKYFSIKENGAIEGGIISNSVAINKTIEQVAAQGGGHVVIPRGIWLTGPIELKSNIDLHLEDGAVLLFNKNKEEYPVEVKDYEGQTRFRAKSPITAKNVANVAITGKGTIDGNGQLWRVVKHFKVTEKQWENMLKESENVIPTGEGGMWFPTQSAYQGCLDGEPAVDAPDALAKAEVMYDFLRPVMVNFIRCDKVLIEGVTLQNSANWNVHPWMCTNLTVRNAMIRNPYYAQNGDGIDVESCKYVEIANTCFDVGDDAICMKSGKNAVARQMKEKTEQVYIHDCIVYHGHGGFVVGSEMSRGIKDVLIENCTFLGTDTGIRFKSQLGRGGIVEDITIKNINMCDIVDQAVIFTMGYSLYKLEHEQKELAQMTDPEDIPEFRNITIENIHCNAAKCGVKIEGLDILPIHDITFENVEIVANTGYSVNNAKDIVMKNTTILNAKNPEEKIYFENDKLEEKGNSQF